MSEVACIAGVKERGVVIRIVDKYYKRYGDQIERQELMNIAIVAAIQAEKNWKPDGGKSRSSYVWTAVDLTLYKQTVWMTTPVHGTCHNMKSLRKITVFYLPIETKTETKGTLNEARAHGNIVTRAKEEFEHEGPMVLAERSQMYQRLYNHILATPAGQAAVDVLIGGKTIDCAAKKYGLSKREIRQSKKAAKAAIKQDAVLEEYTRLLP